MKVPLEEESRLKQLKEAVVDKMKESGRRTARFEDANNQVVLRHEEKMVAYNERVRGQYDELYWFTIRGENGMVKREVWEALSAKLEGLKEIVRAIFESQVYF